MTIVVKPPFSPILIEVGIVLAACQLLGNFGVNVVSKPYLPETIWVLISLPF